MKKEDWISVDKALPPKAIRDRYSAKVLAVCKYIEHNYEAQEICCISYDYSNKEWVVPRRFYEEWISEWRVTHWSFVEMP